MKRLLILTLFILSSIAFAQNEYFEKWAVQDSGYAYVNMFQMSPRFYLGAFKIPALISTKGTPDSITFKVGFHPDSLAWLVETDSSKYTIRVKLDSWIPVSPLRFYPFKYVQIFHSDSVATTKAGTVWKYIERRY